MWVPVPPSAEAALAGATVLPTSPAARSPSPAPRTAGCWSARRRARCLAAYLYAAAGAGRVDHRPVLGRPDDGLRDAASCSARPSASPTGRGARSPTSTSTGSARSGCGRAPSTTTGATPTAAARRLPHGRRSRSTRRPATSACAARSTASRSCPTTPSGSRWTATRPTTSRSPGSSSGCARSASPKVVIGVSGGLDSTHALIVAAKAMDRLGRPRSDILAFTMPGFATSDEHQGQRDPAVQGARRDLRGARHPAGRAADARRPRPPVRRRRAGLRRHVRERPGRAAHRLPVPAGQPARRHRARHRRPVRARAGLVHLRRRRPDVALRRQHRRARRR